MYSSIFDIHAVTTIKLISRSITPHSSHFPPCMCMCVCDEKLKIYPLNKFEVHNTVLFPAVTRCTLGPQTYSWNKRSGWACAGPGSSPSSLGFLVLVGQAPGALAPTHSLGSALCDIPAGW